jgi:hypothetical protein
METCYVTAFYDIGREKWEQFSRSLDKYMENFIPLLKLFDRATTSRELIIFIDERHLEKVEKLVRENIRKELLEYCVRIIPISERFLTQNIPVWSRLKREEEIMNSSEYQTLFSHRLNYPEQKYPKYTLINHAKIDFVNYAINISFSRYFCWLDFGYNPDGAMDLLDVSKFPEEKITYILLSQLQPQDFDRIYTIMFSYERVGGGFFFGGKSVMKKYQKLYHEIHRKFQDNNLADDDQHFVIQSYKENPELFNLVHLGGWFKALVTYQKSYKSSATS